MGLNLHAKVSLDGAGFEAGIRRLEHVGTHAFSELKTFALQAFGVMAAERMFEKSIANAKELVTSAQKLGTSVEGFQVFRQAIQDGNGDLDTMTKLFEKLNIARDKVLNKRKGFEDVAAALKGLGVGDVKMSTEEMIKGPLRNSALSMNVANLDPLLKMATGLKTVSDVVPFLKTDFEELGAKMQRMGTIMDTHTAVKLKILGDEFELFGKILLVKTAPALLAFTEILIKCTAGLSGAWLWISTFLSKVTPNMGGVGGLAGKMPSKEFLAANPDFGQSGKTVKDAAHDANDAAKEEVKTFSDFLKEMKEKMKAIEEAILHPPAPTFEDSSTAKAKSAHNRVDSADSLVRVGNFLGDSQGALVGIAERHLQETRAMHQTIKRMKGLSSNNTDQDPAFA